MYLNHYIIKSDEVSKADYAALGTVPAIRTSLVNEDIIGIDKDCYNDTKESFAGLVDKVKHSFHSNIKTFFLLVITERIRVCQIKNGTTSSHFVFFSLKMAYI